MRSEVYNINCMEYMKTLPDKYFDILIADPPYRNMNENAPQKEMREHGNMIPCHYCYMDYDRRTCTMRERKES